MIRLFILLFLLSANLITFAQKDSTVLLKNAAIKSTDLQPIKLTKSQQQWLNNNYKKIAGLKKDSAAAMIRKDFLLIAEATLEYLIGLAGRLQQQDSEEVRLLKKTLENLKLQRNALQQVIESKTKELELILKVNPTPERVTAVTNEIIELRKQLKKVDENIRIKEEEIKKIEAN